MKIESGCIVTLAYDITKSDGEIIESSDISGPISVMHGKGSVIPGLDAKLEGLEEGSEDTFEFPPEEAFGTRDQGPTKQIPNGEFPEGMNLEVGAKFEAGMGGGQSIELEVIEVGDEAATVRMIHPLAGETIGMSVKVISVREATAKETEAGRALTTPPPPPPK